jgi:hypothetical protein
MLQLAIALVAMATGLIVALIQYFSQRRTSEEVKRLEASLDVQKGMHLEFMKLYLNALTDGRGKEIAAFETLLETTQALRDKLRSSQVNLNLRDPAVIGRDIDALAENISKSYREHQIHLAEEDRLRAHALKEQALWCAEKALASENLTLDDWMADAEANPARLQAVLRQSAMSRNRQFVSELSLKLEKGS